MKLINLFIDELGQSNPKAPNAGVYILSGCMLDRQARDDLKIKADQIKFKYWNRTDTFFIPEKSAGKRAISVFYLIK